MTEEAIPPQVRTDLRDNPFLGASCEIDNRPIKMLAYMGTGVCCELCRKFRDKEIGLADYNKIKSGQTE